MSRKRPRNQSPPVAPPARAPQVLGGAPFTLAELQRCIGDAVAVTADELFAFEYP